jgi:flagellar motor component MotA
MQIIGVTILMFVIWYGFRDRTGTPISAFDPHALFMVLAGSISAVIISSKARDALMTITGLGEFIPGIRRFAKRTKKMEEERELLVQLWRDGKRSAASEMAAASHSPAIARMLELILSRSRPAVSASAFLELRHREIEYWQPIVHNWAMLAKLGPAFGMIGTISGMVQLFKNMSSSNLNLGSSISLALLTTLYGLAFGAGFAGPVSHFLNGLLDERIGCLERCEKSVNELISRAEQ